MDSKQKMGTDQRAAEWALKRHLEGKTKLSPYQLRNIKKVISTASEGRDTKTTKTKTKTSSLQVSYKDLDELKKITKRANDILQKYSKW